MASRLRRHRHGAIGCAATEEKTTMKPVKFALACAGLIGVIASAFEALRRPDGPASGALVLARPALGAAPAPAAGEQVHHRCRARDHHDSAEWHRRLPGELEHQDRRHHHVEQQQAPDAEQEPARERREEVERDRRKRGRGQIDRGRGEGHALPGNCAGR